MLTETPANDIILIKCPTCSGLLGQCENCFSLTIGIHPFSCDNDDIGVYCKKCGFLNLIDISLRRILSMNTFYHIEKSNLRLIQRCISEKDYYAYKGRQIKELEDYIKVEELHRLKNPVLRNFSIQPINLKRAREENKEDSEMSEPPEKRQKTTHYQSSPESSQVPDKEEILSPMKPLLTPEDNQNQVNLNPFSGVQYNPSKLLEEFKTQINEMRDISKLNEDMKSLNEIHFQFRAKSFTSSSFIMLKSLYADSNHSNQDLFSAINEFMQKRINILQLKIEKELASTVWIKSNSLFNQNDKRSDFGAFVQKTVENILKDRHTRLRELFNLETQNYLKLLVDVSKELKRLYKLLQGKQKEIIPKYHHSNMSLCNLSPMLSGEGLKKEIQHENDKDLIICCINLWKLLYRTLSACVL